MIFQRVNRSNAERVFVVMQANEANIAADDVVQLELTAASVDGVKIVQPNTGELNAVVGIADAAIANGAYGLVQVYGYRSTSKVIGSGTSMAVGYHLIPIAGSDTLGALDGVGGASAVNYSPAFIALESVASSAGTGDTTTIKIFIRCM